MPLTDWAGPAAAVLGALGTPDLPRALAELLRQVAPFSHTVTFRYQGPARPVVLHDDFPAAKRQVFVTDYQAGPYLLDPFYLAATKPVAPGLYRLREIAPDRFYQGEYFRNYYARTGLAEEIAYLAHLQGGRVAVMSLMRTERPFSQREFGALRAIFPFVAAAAGRHWASRSGRRADRAGTRGGAPEVLRDRDAAGLFGEGVLTPREREVAEFTLRGHSSESTGRILGIAPGTVRIHRRNIYAKLRITSQGELFSRFLDTLAARG